jgi:long-subunit acyl-CoA synthetase (AMP-forming)
MWQLDGKRYWAEERVVVPGENMAEMFWNAVALRGELTLFRQKKFGLWQSLSWNEVGAIVREAGMGLIELGLEVGETASILGNTRQEWLFSDLALLSCGGVSSGIYPTDASPQVEYLTGDSNSVLIFVEDDEQLRAPARNGPRTPRPAGPGGVRCRMADTHRGAQARGPGDPDLHLGHHRQAQGRDALARQPALGGEEFQQLDGTE